MLSEKNEQLRLENEELRDFIEWLAKNLPLGIAITKRTNGLYGCRIKKEVGNDEAIERLSEDNERLRKLLKECQRYVEMYNTWLGNAIEKEVGDE